MNSGRRPDLISTLGLGKCASDHSVVQVKNFVDERGFGIQQDRDQRGLMTFDLEILQMVNGRLGAFPSEAKEVVLMDSTTDFNRKTDLA